MPERAHNTHASRWSLSLVPPASNIKVEENFFASEFWKL
jgi:hypothetical protein